ncbi:AAA family ATPase [Algibacter pacificus]|uniref:AAA family ATPase n=1 Tax=Algibacter pacificus TaxID=2599389 RepID=UPI0011CC98F9|nr:AAA family ATPase [Algibacter pacificus]
MSNFRLLSIIPFKGCDEKFSKNLIIGKPYKFTEEYSIELNKDNSKIEKVISVNKIDGNNIYKLKNGINIEISAVVGLNGSGKSALIELLYYLIYALSIYNKKQKLLDEHSEVLDPQIDKAQSDARKLENQKNKNLRTIELLKFINDNKLIFDKKDLQGITNGQTLIKSLFRKRLEFLLGQQQDDLKIERLIKNNLAASIVYIDSDIVYSVSFSKRGKLEFYEYSLEGKPIRKDDFFFDPFFYSICLNYSHHSLNSKVMGNWINSLFHKNDGYTTPVVINPMRDEGNFNINRELHLSKERIMSNLSFDVVLNKKVSLLEKYELKKFLYFTKKDFELIKRAGFEDKDERLKYTNTRYLDIDDFDSLKSVKLVRSILGNNYLRKYTNYQDYALGYLEKKIDRIKDNYSHLFRDKNLNHNNNKFMAFLRNDRSHITRKLRQTINFIKYTNEPNSIWNTRGHHSYRELTPDDLKIWINECNLDEKKLTPSLLMDYALPGFFNIDFEVSVNKGKNLKLSELSSGEQQMIFNINTITYHLYNLHSVHFSEENTDVTRIAYKNVAVILDEVEIYYHPDMQRELTSSILNALENIKRKGQKGVESIHLIYLTHSPFILSDIISSNILRLDNGKIKTIEEQTFGANIHDLLANDFFLKNGFMGEVAKEKINEVVEIMKDIQDGEYLKDTIDNLRVKCKTIINIVGEPILYMSLMDLYTETFKDSKIEFIDEQIKKLEQLRNDSNSSK